jgi:hypothetical protein
MNFLHVCERIKKDIDYFWVFISDVALMVMTGKKKLEKEFLVVVNWIYICIW